MMDDAEKERLRQEDKMEGIRRAWLGCDDKERRAAIAFFINYAKTHEEFLGGEVLEVWRESGDPIAQKDWRNRWGSLCYAMSCKKWGPVVTKIGVERPKSVQSHGDYAAKWKSLIYQEDL